jgi:hypothetical protein
MMKGSGQTSLMKWAEGHILTTHWNSACVTSLPSAIDKTPYRSPLFKYMAHKPLHGSCPCKHGNRGYEHKKTWTITAIRENSAWNLWNHMFARAHVCTILISDLFHGCLIFQSISLQLLNTCSTQTKENLQLP